MLLKIKQLLSDLYRYQISDLYRYKISNLYRYKIYAIRNQTTVIWFQIIQSNTKNLYNILNKLTRKQDN